MPQTVAEPVAVRDGRLNARTRPFPVTGTRSGRDALRRPVAHA